MAKSGVKTIEYVIYVSTWPCCIQEEPPVASADPLSGIKHELEGWREVLLPLNKLLNWEKPVYPAIIAGSTTFVFMWVAGVSWRLASQVTRLENQQAVFMPPPFEEWWRGIKCYPCLCVRPSVIKIWCPLNNFWKTASIQFKFGMLIYMYNIKTQVKFDLGYNLLIFDRVMGLL